MVSCAAQFKNQAYDHLVPLSYINMNINSCSSCEPAPVRIKNNVLWCGHIFLKNKKKICKIFNIWLQTQTYKKTAVLIFYVPQPSLIFPAAFVP